jgi:hypothetical protein
LLKGVENDLQEVKEKTNDRNEWSNKGEVVPLLN